MKLANVDGRAAVVLDDGGVDVATASDGRFGPDPMAVLDDWDAFRSWADTAVLTPTTVVAAEALGPPSPQPRQVFGIGLNYRAHAAETGQELPTMPSTFTKFRSCLAGPFAEIPIPSDVVDWEVELVIVVGRRAHQVAAGRGWERIVGVTVGQDVSERRVQRAAGGQFSLGKSFPNFGPTGPWLVTPDELPDRDDLRLTCTLDGEVVQDARTSDMVFDVDRLIRELSAIVTLLPGDLVFTGTPAGVGVARTPRRFLQPGQMLESTIECIGSMRNPCVDAPGDQPVR